MAAMEGHGNRAAVEQRVEADRCPPRRGGRGRHRLAGLRRRFAGAILAQLSDEPIHAAEIPAASWPYRLCKVRSCSRKDTSRSRTRLNASSRASLPNSRSSKGSRRGPSEAESPGMIFQNR